MRLILIGEGQKGRKAPRSSDSPVILGCRNAITFLGHIENPLPEIAQTAARVHCARVAAVGKVLLEALARAVPSIAADCEAGGHR